MAGVKCSTQGVIMFLFDESGKKIGFTQTLNNVTKIYYYVYNALGDVVQLLDINGYIVAKYEYDAWGNILYVKDGANRDVGITENHIANVNPIMYRGYFFDLETGFYYCGSRYYDPVVGRWINGDSVLADTNLYAYCGNNPVMRTDPTGRNWLTDKLKAIKDAVVDLGNSIGNAIINVFNAIVNVAVNDTVANGGNYDLANQIADQVKMGDGSTTPAAQTAVNVMTNNTFVADVTVSMDASKIIPAVNAIPVIGNILGSVSSVNVGISRTISYRYESSTFIHAGFSGGYGKSIIDGVNISYSVGIIRGYSGPSSITGWGYNAGFNYLWAGGSYGSWFGSDVASYMYNVSTGVSVSAGVGYTLDLGF